MATIVKDLGAVTAYAYAKEKGYTGTEDEFAELMASYADVAEQASESAAQAGASATAAEQAKAEAVLSASAAASSASTASTKASEAASSASSAAGSANTATTKANEASTSATNAASSASAAATSATNAGASATAAASSATAASNAQTAAETAQGKAEDAQTAAEDAAASVSASAAQITQNTEDVADLKSSLIDSDAPIDKQVNWINAYIDSTGTVRASSLSRAAVVPMRAWERVQIGTTNTNITIVGTTDSASIAVGDTITPILRTSNVSQFETFEYTAKEDLNITLCVNWSDYSLKFFVPSYAKTEISNMRSEVFSENPTLLSDLSYNIVSGGSLPAQATNVVINFPVGTKYKFIVNDPSGCISKYYLYLNNQSDYQPYFPNTEYIQRTSGAVTTIGFYVDRTFAVADGEISFELYEVFENPESIETKAESALNKANLLDKKVDKDGIKQVLTNNLADVISNILYQSSAITVTGTTAYVNAVIYSYYASFTVGDKFMILVDEVNGATAGSPYGIYLKTSNNTDIRQGQHQGIEITQSDINNGLDHIDFILYPAKGTALPTGSATFTNVRIVKGDEEVYEVTGALKQSIKNTFYIGVDAVPDYYHVNNYISGKAARINTLGEAGDDVFFFITDVHWELNAKHSPALIEYLSHNCKIARLFDGGDLANGVIPKAIKAYDSAFDGRIYRVCGNHDWFPPETGKSLYYWLNSNNYDQNGDAFGHYWYIDNVQQKIRYITLNSFKHSGDTVSSGWEYGYDADQIAWFTNEALNVPNGYDVIVFAHWFRNKQGGYTGYTDIESAIASFNADTSDHGRVICIFQGHAHWDAVFHTSSGVPVITTTCDKYDISNEPDISEEVRTLGTINEQAFEVCVLNREAKTITCVRIGALAQNNIDVGRTDTGFTFAQTLEERVVSYE